MIYLFYPAPDNSKSDHPLVYARNREGMEKLLRTLGDFDPQVMERSERPIPPALEMQLGQFDLVAFTTSGAILAKYSTDPYYMGLVNGLTQIKRHEAGLSSFPPKKPSGKSLSDAAEWRGGKMNMDETNRFFNGYEEALEKGWG